MKIQYQLTPLSDEYNWYLWGFCWGACLAYANAEVFYRAELYFLLSLLFYYLVFVLNGHIKMWYSVYFSQGSKYMDCVICSNKWDVTILNTRCHGVQEIAGMNTRCKCHIFILNMFNITLKTRCSVSCCGW